MEVLICSDSFKHSLSAYEACQRLAEGLKAEAAGVVVGKLPLADGGEGTVRALIDATDGVLHERQVHDPLMRETTATYGVMGDGETAVIEMAAASGIEKLEAQERNPFVTTSYGTGELIRAAMEGGCRRIILGIGGSATIDGGAGMLQALGARFYDKNGQLLNPTTEKLNYIERIDTEKMDPRLQQISIAIASDVDNPLTGPNGAAYVYGPQKGAEKGDLKILDQNLAAYARVLQQHTQEDMMTRPGTGAAGGMAISLLAFSRASLENGFQLVAKALNLEQAIASSDMIITGEGQIDAQTHYGKTPAGVARLAHKHNKPVIAVTGSLEANPPGLFDLLLPVMEKPMDNQAALSAAGELLFNAGSRIGKILLLAKRLYSPEN